MSDGKYLNDKRRCEICDWSWATQGSTYCDTTARRTDKTSDEYLAQRKPSRVAPRDNGQDLCNNCWSEIQRNLTQLNYDDKVRQGSKKRLERNFSHSYFDLIGDELVEVKVYKPTHPRLR